MKLDKILSIAIALFIPLTVCFFVFISVPTTNYDAIFGLFSKLLGNTIVIRNEKIKFNTADSSIPTVKILDVKFDRQDYTLSCEVAALKMVLKYRGMNIDEDELFSKLPTDQRSPKIDDDGTIRWGDPNRAFVGNRDGKMFIDGYGVHWEPISALANSYRESDFFSRWTVDDLVDQIDRNNPVIIWGYYGPGSKHKWYTWDGRKIDAVKFEHTYIVNGYEKKDGILSAIFVIDSNRGKLRLSVSDFNMLWQFYNNSGVIVY